MYHPPKWITLWFAISSVIVTWGELVRATLSWWMFADTRPAFAPDFLYCFLRPRSMEGGDLFWLWYPYKSVEYFL
jgi:hypothetical protein